MARLGGSGLPRKAVSGEAKDIDHRGQTTWVIVLALL